MSPRLSYSTNAFYQVAFSILKIIFPLLTYPYVARVLGPSGVGTVAYGQQFANYFTMIAALGLPLYGIRTIAQTPESHRSAVFSRLFWINFSLTIFMAAAYSGIALVLPAAIADRRVHFVFLLSIVSGPFAVEWWFKGVENFRFVVLRNLLVRVLSVLAIFVFVGEESDFVRYAWIWAAGTCAGAALNFFVASRQTSLHSPFKTDQTDTAHLKGLLGAFAVIAVSSLYQGMDIIMLRWMVDAEAVGYYSIAYRVTRIILIAVASFAIVAVPRASRLHAEGEAEKFAGLLSRNIAVTLFLVLPAAMGTWFVAKDLIIVFAGEEFLPAGQAMRYLSGYLVVASVASITSTQLLYARGKDKQYISIVGVAALAGLSLNWVLIPLYAHSGAAMATTAAETVSLTLQIGISWKLFARVFPVKEALKIGAAVLAMLLSVSIANSFLVDATPGPRLAIVIPVAAISYAFVAALTRIEIALLLIRRLRERIAPRK